MRNWKGVKVGDRLQCVADPETSELYESFENWAKIEGVKKGETYTVLVVNLAQNPCIKIDGPNDLHLWLLKDQAHLFKKIKPVKEDKSVSS